MDKPQGRRSGRLAGALTVMALMASLTGCAGPEGLSGSALPAEPGHNLMLASPVTPLQCVPYARAHSSVKIYGDAVTWWQKAAGRFQRSARPQVGAVMVLMGYAGPEHGHVAVVRSLVSPREIRVDHANWLDDGSIYLDDPVADVSADNDWSQVKVWNIKNGAWGGRTYPVKGFIGPGPQQGPTSDRIALAGKPAG